MFSRKRPNESQIVVVGLLKESFSFPGHSYLYFPDLGWDRIDDGLQNNGHRMNRPFWALSVTQIRRYRQSHFWSFASLFI